MTKTLVFCTLEIKGEILLWHDRLGHPNFLYLKRLVSKLFSSADVEKLICETCQLTKHTKHNYPAKAYKASTPFNLVHSDIWGRSRIANINSAKWFITFVDDHTRVTWVYLLKNKSDIGQTVIRYMSFIKNQLGCIIKTLSSNNGTEYLDKTAQIFMIENGIHSFLHILSFSTQVGRVLLQ